MPDEDLTRPSHPHDDRTVTGHSDGTVVPAGAATNLPPRVGRYRPLRIIGQGGMGIVYEAEQEEPRRRVALKVIRPELATADLRRRFAHESLFLGRLQHPGIAQVYEAGTAETPDGPLPFIAMELVDGVRLNEWARGRKGTPRGGEETAPALHERVELMIRLCDAVHHAHQRGLIHRDLKPGNVLVDGEGRPRVLDFGVARPADVDLGTSLVTSHGELVGTLAYMSPEQLAGDPNDLDTRSDVYAMGVILYELLAGRAPLELGRRPLEETLRALREDEAPPLSQLDARLAGDLTVIAAKAMAKDREQRYASANGLAMDLQRYLDDEPISARAPGTVYLLRKFTRRHRPLVMAAAGVATALVLGVVVSTWQAVRATRAEKLAAARLDQAGAVTDFLQGMLESVQPEQARGNEVTVAEVLDRAAADLDQGQLSTRPIVELALRQSLGGTYRALGKYDLAERHLRQGRALADSLLPPSAPERLKVELELARTLHSRGDYAATEQLIRAALPHVPPRSALMVPALDVLADVCYSLVRWDECDSLRRLAVTIAKETAAPDSLEYAQTLLSYAFLANERSRTVLADSLIALATPIYTRAYRPDDPRTVWLLMKQGESVRDAGRFADAVATFARGLSVVETSHGPDHPLKADLLWRIGEAQAGAGNLAAAESSLTTALEIRRRALGPRHRDIAVSLSTLAGVYAESGRVDAADSLMHEALSVQRGLFGPIYPAVAATIHDIADLERRRGRPAVAESLVVVARDILDQLPTPNPYLAAMNAYYHAMTLQDRGLHADAEAHFRREVALQQEVHRGPHDEVARSMGNLVTNLFRQGRKDEAATLQVEALAMLRQVGAHGAVMATALGNTAYILDDAGRHAEAAPYHLEYIELTAQIFSEDKPDRTAGRSRYFENLARQGLWAEAEAQARAIIDWRRLHLAADDIRQATGQVQLLEALLGLGRTAAADSALAALEGQLPRFASLPEATDARLARVREALKAARQHG
jgi:tetratricopeptide (TPR) repeat protein/tRNA A-37 threonylcarbamoyl transferase component Bud32